MQFDIHRLGSYSGKILIYRGIVTLLSIFLGLTTLSLAHLLESDDRNE